MATTTELLQPALRRMAQAGRVVRTARASLRLRISAALALGVLTHGALSAPGLGSAPPVRPLRSTIGCLIAPDKVADIGSPVVGIVSKMKVDVGDTVHTGQTLVLLRSEVEAASVHAAKARAGIDADVRAAEANLQLARQRHERARELLAQGFVSAQAADQARAEQDVAVQKLRQAQGQLRVSDGDLGVLRAQLGQRKLKSEFDGVVIDRFVNAGEHVDDKPLLRIARLDPLRVELVVPASRYGSIALKDRIQVAPDLPGIAPVLARVTHIDPIIDAASNTFRVRLKLPNPDHKLPGGARCRVDLPSATGATPAAPALLPLRGEPIGKVAG
jgi:RND family efflux transporter MFP subunit